MKKINKFEIMMLFIFIVSFGSAMILQGFYDWSFESSLLVMFPGIVIGIRAWYIVLKNPVVR